MGPTCRERRNTTAYWWENLLKRVNLEEDGNTALRGILNK
jgi:hypothetical protein